jgi:hypothetical protein
MGDEKDRLGQKLREKEKAEEDRYFAERDKALLEKLRRKRAATDEQKLHEQTHMRCPKCGEKLGPVEHHGVTAEECPACHGMWLDRGKLEVIAARERDSWLGRFFLRPRH